MLTLASECQDRPLRRRSGSAVLWAAALTLTVTLAGCATDPEPQPTPTAIETITETPTPAPTPSETVEVTEPSEPDPSESEPNPAPTPPDPSQLINENTEEGAKSAVQYFWDLQTFTMTTQSLEIWDRNTSKDCEFCEATRSKVRELKDASLSVEGGEVTAGEIGFIEEKWSQIWLLEHEIFESAVTVRTNAGESVSGTENSESTVRMYLKFIDNSWLLEEVSS